MNVKDRRDMYDIIVDMHFTAGLRPKHSYITEMGDAVWLAANKVKYLVHEMTVTHINNALACLHGHSDTVIPDYHPGYRDKWIRILQDELYRRFPDEWEDSGFDMELAERRNK